MTWRRFDWLRALSPARRVLGLIVVVGVVDIVLLALLGSPAPVLPHVRMPLWGLTALFALVEWRVIHIQFRAEASSFSLLEVPLVLALLYSSPDTLVTATALGVGLGLAAGRKQAPVKVVFNVANIVLYASVASLVVAVLPHGGEERWVWLSVVLATALGSAVSLSAIMLAVTLTEGAPSRREIASLVGFGVSVSTANTAIGLTAAVLLAIDPYSLLFLGVPCVLLFLAFRKIASEREQRQRVEFLYRSTRRLDVGGSEAGLLTLLHEARNMFRAELGAVVLLDDVGGLRLVRSSASQDSATAWDDPEAQAAIVAAMNRIDEPCLVGPAAGHTELLRRLGATDAMVAKLATEERELGLLVVANRLGEVTSFSASDLQVLGALARQSAVLMHSDQLEHALVELRKLERQLAHEATHDSLTGLPNRAMFTTSLHDAVSADDAFAVLFIDLDGFKSVNDSHGHSSGDRVLIAAAERIRSLVRASDVAARFGGDEFAVLLRSHPDPGACAKRIVHSLAEPFDVGPADAQIGCSIGIAVSPGGGDVEQLLVDADTAMYEAKQAGKGTVVEHVAGSTGGGTVVTSELGTAIALGGLELHYQPIVDLGGSNVAGVEALVRWRTADGTLLRPGDFLDEAERTGLIVALDRWVLGQAAADVEQLAAAAGADLFVSVNLSKRELREAVLVDWLEQPALEALRPRLVLELSEVALAGEERKGWALIDAVRGLGVRVALDGFGTGASSLTALARARVDILKLGKPLIDRLIGVDGNPALIRGVIDVGHALGLRVVAEAVEREAQLDWLARIGCDLAQGYRIAEPMALDDLVALLQPPAVTTRSADPLRLS